MWIAAATKLTFILVLILLSFRKHSHLKSSIWVLLVFRNAEVARGFSLVTQILYAASREVQSLSFEKPWKNEIQHLGNDVHDSYYDLRKLRVAQSLRLQHLTGLWNLDII